MTVCISSDTKNIINYLGNTRDMNTSKEDAKTIRQYVRKVAPTVSVRKGTGTASSWIDITGSQEDGFFTEPEQKAMFELGLCTYLPFRSNSIVISPESREFEIANLKAMDQAGLL